MIESTDAKDTVPCFRSKKNLFDRSSARVPITEDESMRADYVKSMKWKMAKYHENKIKFISIYPKNWIT